MGVEQQHREEAPSIVKRNEKMYARKTVEQIKKNTTGEMSITNVVKSVCKLTIKNNLVDKMNRPQ